MKKLLLLCFAAICSVSIFAAPLAATSIDASAKIRKVFHDNFPEVNNPTISTVGNFYLVYFADKATNSSCRVFYDADGNVIQTIRNYTVEGLNPFIRAKIDSKYKGKSVFGVTDVTNENEHYYQLILQDATSLWFVQANDNGSMYVQKKYKRAS
jgi:hypothetical protein